MGERTPVKSLLQNAPADCPKKGTQKRYPNILLQ